MKPTLIGGFQGSQSWINIAKENKVKFWTTSALESNIGLNAIAQWTYSKNPDIPQGLGTGGLFTNNISSPIEVKKGKLIYNPKYLLAQTPKSLVRTSPVLLVKI